MLVPERWQKEWPLLCKSRMIQILALMAWLRRWGLSLLGWLCLVMHHQLWLVSFPPSLPVLAYTSGSICEPGG